MVFDNCIDETQERFSLKLFIVKLLRAHGECLGVERR